MLEDFHHLSQPQPKLVRRNLFNPSVIMNAVNQIDYILKTIPPPIKYQKYSKKQARQEYLNNLVLEVKKDRKIWIFSGNIQNKSTISLVAILILECLLSMLG